MSTATDDDFDALLGIPAPFDAIPERELADLLGVTPRQIRSLATDGILRRVDSATYSLRQAVPAYIGRLRDSRAARSSTDAEHKAERTRVAKAQADKLELENATRRGDMIPVADVRREWVSIAADLRSALMAIPSRVSARMGLSREAAVTLETEVRLALEEIPDGL